MLDRAVWLAQAAALLAVIQTVPVPRQRPDPKNPPAGPYQVTTFCIAPVQSPRAPIRVTNGQELQNALDTANAGDTIALAPQAMFRPIAADGSFILRNRPLGPGQWITIRSASGAFDAGGAIPPAKRATPADAAQMPTIRAATASRPAIRTEPGAHGYRLIGLDIGVDDSISTITNLIELGTGSEATVDTQPADIVIDRSYVHGNDRGSFRRGVAMNGRRLAVIESTIENFHDANTDSQAISGWNGPGPFKIVNNTLEAASETIMFGGGDPSIPSLVPSDIEVRRNLMTKRLSWRSEKVPVKNAFELKNARRVLVAGNTFERVWSSGQDGTAIVLKSTNQGGRCTWCVTEYVTFRDNIVRGAASGLTINAAETGQRDAPLPPAANHIRIQNVVFEDIGGRDWGSGGKLFRVFGGVSDVEITHVTSLSNPTGILDPRSPSDSNPNLTFKYNIVERMLYGIGAGGDEGVTTVSRNFAPFVYNQNVLVDTSASTSQAISDNTLKGRYPPVTMIAPGWDAVRFEEGSHKLSASSPYYRAGDDGKDLGADVDAIAAAQAGAGRNADGCGGQVAVPRPPKG